MAELEVEKGEVQRLPVKSVLAEIRAYEREFKDWLDHADDNLEYYRDEGTTPELNSFGIQSGANFNVFWANVQIQRPAYYAKSPNPSCERRYKDRDPLGRLAAEICERIGSYQVSESQPFDIIMRQCVDDMLIAGRGVTWIRRVTQSGEQIGEDEQGALYQVLGEKSVAEFVLHGDFGHNVCRMWEDVTLVWRKLHLTRAEAKKQGLDSELLKFDNTPEHGSSTKDETASEFKRACVYEVWDKEHRQVYWCALESKDVFLKTAADPYNLTGFFPCPRPIYSDLTPESLIPITDFSRYEKLAKELDELVARRRELLDAIRVIGTFDASQPELANIFKSGGSCVLVPSNNWTQVKSQGGINGVMDLVDIKPYIEALSEINNNILNVTNSIYELTGISDIIRGYSDPNATATAENIKGNFATLRLESRQKEVQRLARDTIALQTELAVEKFDEQTLYQMASVDQMDEEAQQAAPYAIGVLKDDKLRCYKITIETDSTIAVDEQQEKEARSQALEAYGTFLDKAMPMMAQFPELAPVISEMLLFGARSFKEGRSLEFALEQSLEKVQEKIAQQAQQGPPPDPEMVKAEQAAKAKEAELQMTAQSKQAEMQMTGQMKQAELQQNQAAQQQDMQFKMQLEQAKLNLEREKITAQLQMEKERMVNEFALAQFKASQEHELAVERMRLDHEVKKEQAAVTAQIQAQKAQALSESRSDANS